MRFSITDVLYNPLYCEAPEMAAVHEIDGAELAALSAAPARLHRVDGHVKAVEALSDQPGIAQRHLDLLDLQERPSFIVNHCIALVVGEAQDVLRLFALDLGLN